MGNVCFLCVNSSFMYIWPSLDISEECKLSEMCVISALQKHLVDMNIEGLDSSYLHWIVSTSGSHSSLSSADVRRHKHLD